MDDDRNPGLPFFKATVKSRVATHASALPPLGREKVNAFVDQIVDECPSLSEAELTRVSGVLAKLESAESQYDLLRQLDEMTPGDLDTLHRILKDWTIGMAKVALDAIAKRLKLISELKVKLADAGADEVQELQPLFERGLWIFSPQFEDGVESLVIVELKRRGVPIGAAEKSQAWKYTKELYSKGFLGSRSRVTCFVVGSEIEDGENFERIEREGAVHIVPMLFDVFLLRADRRMLNLHEKLKSAPFLSREQISEFEAVHCCARPSPPGALPRT